jgi:hypothetical protein
MNRSVFKISDLVRMVRAVGSTSHQAEFFFETVSNVIPGGTFEVTAILPERDGQHQYRIRGGDPAQERVVRESQIIHASRPPPRR